MNYNYKKLVLSIALDLIGMLSFAIPGVGELSDLVWAPLSSYLILKLYKGNFSKVASVLSFLEEAAIFGTDLIPTFTLCWIYEHFVAKETLNLQEKTS